MLICQFSQHQTEKLDIHGSSGDAFRRDVLQRKLSRHGSCFTPFFAIYARAAKMENDPPGEGQAVIPFAVIGVPACTAGPFYSKILFCKYPSGVNAPKGQRGRQ